MLRFLLVDPEEDRREAVGDALECSGFETWRLAGASAETALGLEGIDLALIALDSGTLELAEALRRCDPLVPVVAYAAGLPAADVVARLGRARLYDLLHLGGAEGIERHAERLRDAAARGAARRRSARVAEDLLGVSAAMAQVRRYIERAAGSDANVLVTGESGTGKELVARAIHRHCSRRDAPFVAVNCAAIPDTLLESELFGHERGAFTGAVARARGRFEQADGGTLLFDEIGEMSTTLQAKLLRVLQPPPGASETTREFTRVGAEAPTRSDVRLVFATHRDLRALVQQGRFREDLYQRIHVLEIHVPPLRKRREDIPLLARCFLERHAQMEGRGRYVFDPLVLDVLVAHDYPLNVRELEAIVREICIMKEGGLAVVLGDLPASLFEGPCAPADQQSSAPVLRPLAEVEREHVERVLAHSQGNKSLAARILGISRPALDRRLRSG